MIYNADIDKIDKIIINNYDKVTPLSYKILMNKEKTKRKMLEINNFPNLEVKINQQKNNNYSLRNKEKHYKKENIIKNRNNYSLPKVLSKINNSNNNK